MDKIDELLNRGIANIIPSKAELEKALRSGKKLNVYLGIDPTATHIHLGHAVNLRKLKALVELGHTVTFLIGDFTAKVGDSSDKESERPILADADIEKNFQTYKAQAEKVIDFSKVQLRHNSEWLSQLTFADVIKLCQQFTLNDYISREIMKKKLDAGTSIRLDEVLYPIMQGHDSFVLDTDIQVGAADQTFNMQAGRALQKKLKDKESFVLVNQYLTGTDGRKMSKSWGNAIWLDDSAQDVYGKVMSIKDELIDEYFLLATSLPESEFAHEDNPMDSKKKLAWQIVKELFSESEANSAQKHFESTVQNKELPEVNSYVSAASVGAALVESGLVSSNSEARRVIEQKGVKQDGVVVTSFDSPTIPGTTISVGNRKFVKNK